MKSELSAPRVMWLLNHATLREFEMRQLQALGVREIFLPKSFPYDEGNLSASIDASYDTSLSLSKDELSVLNAADWYRSPSPHAWEIANRHFDLLFFAFFPQQMESVTRHFKGDAILRVFGHARDQTYSRLLYQYLGVAAVDRIRRMDDRFWFGQAYAHLHEIEDEFIRRRSCYLPLGLRDATIEDRWRGDDPRLYFVCPRIGSSGHFRTVYETFKSDFEGVDYAIGGAQPIAVKDRRVLGYVPSAVHRENMQRFRVMYYHSTEPNHVHYHPFEAIRVGMPVVYRSGGMLDRLAGERLPGCCASVREARRKVERILAGDVKLIEQLRRTQVRLLDPLRPERCEPVWRNSFGRLLARRAWRASAPRPVARPTRRVAVLVPSFARPADLTYARRIAIAMHEGARAAGDGVHIVIAVAAELTENIAQAFGPLPHGVSVRTFRWNRLSKETAEMALRFAGHQAKLPWPEYIVADDGINHLLDCDLWVLATDELSLPILALRPYCVAVFGYAQRYMPGLGVHADASYREISQRAASVWTASHAVAEDAAQYGGIARERIRVLPPPPPWNEPSKSSSQRDTRAIAVIFDGIPELRQLLAIEALQAYYRRCKGTLPCVAIGRGPAYVGKDGYCLASGVVTALESDRRFRARVTWDSLPFRHRNGGYAQVAAALFTGYADSPACYVADALRARVPLVASVSPSSREWTDAYPGLVTLCDDDALALALQIKANEEHPIDALAGVSPPVDADDFRSLAVRYWDAVREAV